MQRILKIALNPITWAAAILPIALVVNLCIVFYVHRDIAPGFYAYTICLYYIAACWVSRDLKNRSIHFPEDQILLFFWISFPAYLIESRKWKGAAIFIGLIIGYIVLAFCYFTFVEFIYSTTIQ